MRGSDWKVEDVAALLRDGENARHQCCLLIGAGASRSAGVDTGAEFVTRIKEKHPRAYERAAKLCDGNPGYGACMAELSPAERADLVRLPIETAKINWAHIGIARLEKGGYADRIMTTNFDPLASRACALFNRFPAVYDFAALRDADGVSAQPDFIPALVKGSAIYHLHGQHTGFVLLNTEDLLVRQADRIAPVLTEAMNGRVVIVCGYSGENDPLVERIARRGGFPNKLIWVRHDDNDPCENVCAALFDRFPDCHIVRNVSADRFFTELANALDLPQPEFLTNPFQHMLASLDTIRPYSDLDVRGIDLLDQARSALNEALDQRTADSPDQSDIAAMLAEERYQEISAQYEEKATDLSAHERDLVAWAAILEGNRLGDLAVIAKAAEADRLFEQSFERYAAALVIEPDKHEALYNWGTSLLRQAQTKDGAEADTLFALAGEKYAAALAIKPDKHEAFNNWGNALTVQARRKNGAEADALFALAGEKYAAALAIKPDDQEGLYNWGTALSRQSEAKSGAEAAALFALADEKYAAALAIKPDMHDALNNWGAALLRQARAKSGAEADALFARASEKYVAALAIKPDMHEALNNWGNTFAGQASAKSGAEADALFAQAHEKYAAALAIKPDDHEALNNWGNALLVQARTKSGEETDKIFEVCMEKLLSAEKIQPGSASYNLACLFAVKGEVELSLKWLRNSHTFKKLPTCDHIHADTDFALIRQDQAFVTTLAELGCPASRN